jgi:hypothetical protein
MELAELHEHMADVESKRTIEAMQLSRSVMEISDVLVSLGVFPIWDIPEQPRSTQDVLMAASLVLEHLREEHASDASPWVKNLTHLASLQPQAIPPAIFFCVLLARM